MNKAAEQKLMEKIMGLIDNKKPEALLLFSESCVQICTSLFMLLGKTESEISNMVSTHYQPTRKDIFWTKDELNHLTTVDPKKRLFQSSEILKAMEFENDVSLESKAQIVFGLALASYKALGATKESVLSSFIAFSKSPNQQEENTENAINTERD